MRSNRFTTLWLSNLNYTDARSLIRTLLFPLARQGYNFLVCCTHPPTITFGNNMKDVDIEMIKKQVELSSSDICFIKTDRGGKATYHDQNQLMIYPISYLPNFGLGPKSYIENFLFSVKEALRSVGVKSWIDSGLSGIWADEACSVKLGSVGFRFIERFSEHGICLYTSEVSNTFYKFNPCGIASPQFVSISELLGNNIPNVRIIEEISLSIDYTFKLAA